MHLDFSNQAHFLIALAPEIVLSIWGMAILILGVSRRQLENPDAATSSKECCFVAIGCQVPRLWSWDSGGESDDPTCESGTDAGSIGTEDLDPGVPLGNLGGVRAGGVRR